MREGIVFGFRTLGKYLVLFILSLMFLGMIPREQLWLQVLLNAAILAGFALLTFNEAGGIGERAETLRATLEARRKEGGKVDPALEPKAYRPATAVTGFLVAALPLLLIALINLASLPAHPESLDPKNFTPAVEDTAALEAAGLPSESTLPGAAAETTPAPEASATAEAAPTEAAGPVNLSNTVARLAFSPFISLYALLINHLLLLYLLMVPLSFFLPGFALAGYLSGPKLREKKLAAIKKGIRAKKRKERRERRPSGPKPEV